MILVKNQCHDSKSTEFTSDGQASGAIKANTNIVASMGFSARDWELFRNTVAKIESDDEYCWW